MMHSHGKNEMEFDSFEVLILVVMDDALALKPQITQVKKQTVLILVVMDDALALIEHIILWVLL